MRFFVVRSAEEFVARLVESLRSKCPVTYVPQSICRGVYQGPPDEEVDLIGLVHPLGRWGEAEVVAVCDEEDNTTVTSAVERILYAIPSAEEFKLVPANRQKGMVLMPIGAVRP